jgi:hypothetical protein
MSMGRLRSSCHRDDAESLVGGLPCGVRLQHATELLWFQPVYQDDHLSVILLVRLNRLSQPFVKVYEFLS